MGELHSIGNVVIRVYANDHLPPHVHLVGPDQEALVEIATGRVLVGKVPSRESLEWTLGHLDRIRDEWNRVNLRFPIA